MNISINCFLLLLQLFGYCSVFSQGERSNESLVISSINDTVSVKDEMGGIGILEKPPKSRGIFRLRRRSAGPRSSFRLWKMPIHFRFDGGHKAEQKQAIRKALEHWMDKTCIRFEEISSTEFYNDHHILFTSQSQGCFSYTGMVKVIPQRVNLDDECLKIFGKSVHEIGHVIGLWHEHQRLDRDDSVEIVEKNIRRFRNQFRKHWKVPEGIPYELGSIMHYSAKDGSVNGELTLRAKNPLYQGNMGQRTALSFADALYVNTMYCKDVCTGRLERQCANGGYRDPKYCTRCRCPDGFSGDFCQDVAVGGCGGIYDVTVDRNVTIQSPGYDDRKPYNHLTTCTWWLKSTLGFRLQFSFVDEFGIYCLEQSCYHWVEVRFGKNPAIEGPRFCCDSRPNVLLTSEDQQMLVLFRSNWNATVSDGGQYGNLRGFRAVVTAVPDVENDDLKH